MSISTGRPSTNQSNSVFVLYRFYGTDNTLLYIGQTQNPPGRMKQHAHEKSWWTEVGRIELQHYGSLPELVAAEREAITSEKPAHNIKMNKSARTTKPASIDPLERSEIDGLVGRHFHSFRDLTDDDENATIINGRVVVWQGRVLEQISDELYTIETYSWWDGCATGHQITRVDNMLDWRFYDTALEMQVALPCGEYHDNGRYCRGERAYYSDLRALGVIHFVCSSCQEYYPGFADYKPLVWRNGKPHLK